MKDELALLGVVDRSTWMATNVPGTSTVMPPAAGPNPQPLEFAALTIESVDEWKRSDCVHYVRCMDTAVRHNWSQFHCNDCRAYEPVPPTEDEKKAALRLNRLLRIMNRP